MANSSEARRRELLADLLPLFRLCADDQLIALILRETSDLDDDAFARGCRGATRDDTQGNPIERIRAHAKPGAAGAPR